MLLPLDDLVDGLVPILAQATEYNKWNDEQQLEFLTALVKYCPPPTLDLNDLFPVTILPKNENLWPSLPTVSRLDT